MNWLVSWSPFYFHRGWHMIGPIAYARLLWRRIFWRPDLLPEKPTAGAYSAKLADVQRAVAGMAADFAKNENIAGSHAQEDFIRELALRAISEGATNPIELATVALQTGKVEFNRGYK